MVGPPKTLEDLRRVEGAVRVTCRACGHVRMLDREELIVSRGYQRKTTDWSTVQHDQICAQCSSYDTRVDGVPFADDANELRRRRTEMLLVNLALSILEDAARHSATERPAEKPVRLALRVLHPHLHDAQLLRDFWTHSMERDGSVGAHPHLVIRWIVGKLVDRGYAIWAELR